MKFGINKEPRPGFILCACLADLTSFAKLNRVACLLLMSQSSGPRALANQPERLHHDAGDEKNAHNDELAGRVQRN